jgi:hypothetical protein
LIFPFKGKETDLRIKQLESDITYLIAKQERELILAVNNAAYHGELQHLKGLINAGADPTKTDYDGRSALVRPFIFVNPQVCIIICEKDHFHCFFFYSQNKFLMFDLLFLKKISTSLHAKDMKRLSSS